MPKFSIIVPVYNSEKYLNKCIESILNQSIDDFELILINDGSSDSSGSICDEYSKKDNRIVVLHKCNGGVSSSRNIGIDMSRGEYITFIDSDDYIDSEYLNYLYKHDVDITIGNIKFLNLHQRTYYTLKSELQGNLLVNKITIDELIKNRYISSACAKLYKSEIIRSNNIKFDTNINLGEDTMFVAEYLSYSKKMYIGNKIIYNYMDYGTESLSKFDISKFKMLELANKYISESLSNVYKISESIHYKERIWSNYEWAIFETINSNMSYLNKRKILGYIFNNENFNCLISDIDYYMENHPKKVRNIISTKNINIVLLFFKLSYIKNKFRTLYKEKILG